MSAKKQNFQYFKTTLLEKENVQPTNCESDVSLSSSMELDESFRTYLKNNVSNELKEKFFNNTNKYNYIDKSSSASAGESTKNNNNTTTTTNNESSSMKTCIDFTLRTNCTSNYGGDTNSSSNDTTNSKYLTSESISHYEEDSLNGNKNILKSITKRSLYDDDSLENIITTTKSDRNRLSIINHHQLLSIVTDDKLVCKEESVISINSSNSDDSCNYDGGDDDNNGSSDNSDIKYISQTTADEIPIKQEIPDGNLTNVGNAAVATIKSDYNDDLNNTTSIDGKISNKSYGSSSYQTATMGIESGDSSIISLRSENFNSNGDQSSIDNYGNIKNSTTTTTTNASTDTSLNSNENHYSVNSSKSSISSPQLLMHKSHQMNQHILNNNTQSIESSSSNGDSSINEKSNFSIPSISRMNNDYNCNDNSNESNSNDDCEERKFNDTLEEVEFLIEQGMKMKAMAETNKNNKIMMDSMNTPINIQKNRINIRTPETQNKTPKTPNTVISIKTKQPQYSRSPMQYDQFKKPAIINHHQQQQQQQPTRIPKRILPNYPQQQNHHQYHQQHLTPFINNKRFEHIVSPISQYIKSGQSPLIKTIANTDKNFFDSTLCQQLDYSRQSSMAADESDGIDHISNPSIESNELPRKAFISTEHCQMVDNRKMIVPGGASVQRLIGDVPYAIKHTGRVHLEFGDDDGDAQQKYEAQGVYENHTPSNKESKSKYDSSFADLSIMPGDLSIQVVKNVQRL